MKGLAEVQKKIQEVMEKINNNPDLLNMNHNQTGNIENIVTAARSVEDGEFKNAINEISEVINELNTYASDLMNKIDHHHVSSRYPESGPKKYEKE